MIGKDLSLLREVSDYFTEETFKKIIAKEKNVDKHNVEIIGWDFGEASAKGDSYMSVVNRILIKSKVNNEDVETRLVVKSLPRNIARRKTFRSVDFFHNENVFYSEVATRFEKYLNSKGQSQLLCIPRWLDFVDDGENDYLVLEDVSFQGFGSINRQNALSYEPIKYTVETMARFHAISFGYKKDHKEEYDKISSMLTETFFRHDIYEKWYKRFHTTTLLRIAKDALAKEYPGSEAEKVFNSYEPGALVKKSSDLCLRTNEPTSVVGQGDAWIPNFLAREISPGKFDVLMLDFQLARSCSPVIDISFFIYASTDKAMRDKYYDRIWQDYYNELSKSMKLLNVDPEKVYPWSLLQKEIKEFSVVGLTFALEAVPFTMMPSEEAFDLDQLVKDEEANIADIWTVPNIQSSENRKRHAENIIHAVENGFI